MLIISLVAYLLLLVLLSKLLAKRMSGLMDFFLAGQRLPVIAVALTFVASWFGAGSTIGTMNQAFDKGLSALWMIAIPSFLSCLIVALLWAKRIRQLNCLSQPEAVERHYGPFGSFMLAWIILAATTTFIASQLVAAGQLLQMTMGLSAEWSVILIMGAIVLYSVIGGFRAVVMTDILQFACFTGGILILLLFAGLSSLSSSSAAFQPPVGEFWNPFFNFKENMALMFTFVLAWSIAPEMWQRMSSARNPEDAQRAALIAGLLLVVLYAMVIAAGILAAHHHLPPESHFARKNVLVSLALMLPFPLLTAIVLVGVLSAIGSTIDSSLNVGSLTFTRDILHRHIWQQATDGQLVLLSRITTAVIAVPACLIALFYQNIIQVLWISADIYASTMFVPIAGLFFVPNAGRLAGTLAMIFGLLPVMAGFLNDLHLVSMPFWWPSWPYTTLIGVGFSAIGFGAGFWLSRFQEKGTDILAPEPAAALQSPLVPE